MTASREADARAAARGRRRTPAARTPATVSAGSRRRTRPSGSRRSCSGSSRSQVGVASTGVIGSELPREAAARRRARRGRAARRRRRRLLARDPHERPRAEAGLPAGRAPERDRPARSAGEGRGDDLAAVRDDVLLRPDRRRAVGRDARPAHGRDGQALVRPHQRRRAAVHQRHRVRARERGRPGSGVEPESEDELRFGEAMDALLRELALQIVADGEGCKRVGRIVVRGAGEVVEPVARAIANSPLVKTALHGGDPNFGRILQAAGAVLPARQRLRRRPRDRGTARRLRRRGGDRRPARARAARLRRRGRVRARRCPERARETEVFFSDLSHGLRRLQLRVHILTVTQTSPPCSRRCRTSANSIARPW